TRTRNPAQNAGCWRAGSLAVVASSRSSTAASTKGQPSFSGPRTCAPVPSRGDRSRRAGSEGNGRPDATEPRPRAGAPWGNDGLAVDHDLPAGDDRRRVGAVGRAAAHLV